MMANDRALAYSLGARGDHEVQADYVEHCCTLKARYGRGGRERECRNWKYQVSQMIACELPPFECRRRHHVLDAADRKERNPVGEDERHHEREPEIRHRVEQ